MGIVYHNDDVIRRGDLLRRDSKILTPVLIDGRTTETTRDVEGVFALVLEINTLVFETLETRRVGATIGERDAHFFYGGETDGAFPLGKVERMDFDLACQWSLLFFTALGKHVYYTTVSLYLLGFAPPVLFVRLRFHYGWRHWSNIWGYV